MRPDTEMIRRAADLALAGVGVAELRALHVASGNGFTRTWSGYFDDPKALAKAAANIEGARGIYLTINTVDAALLSRAANRVRPINKGDPTTTDAEITGLSWLPVDVDAIRPAGVSSTDAEHEAAIERARQIVKYLRECGWPDPVAGDSGNGAHLLYRIDLPVEDRELVKRALVALAALHDDNRAKIDTAVHNPARIWRLYGTVAAKGDSTPERPHRVSRLLSVPDPIETVPRELLEALAAEAPKPRRPAHPSTEATVAEDRERLIDRCRAYLARVDPAIEGQGGDAATIKAAMIGGDFGLNETEFWPLLCEWNQRCSPPWEKEELRTKLNRAEKYRKNPPGCKVGEDRPPRHHAPTCDTPQKSCRNPIGPEEKTTPTFLPTDYGNAQRLVARHGEDLRYVSGWGWCAWDGQRWRRDDTGEAMRRAKESARALLREAADIPDEDARKRAVAHALDSERAPRLRAALELAQSEAESAARPCDFDANPWLFTVANGTLDLKTGGLREHRREDLITRASPTVYDRAAEAQMWRDMLDMIFAGDGELISFVQRLAGYCLVGVIRERRCLFLLHGPSGKNGKSCFLTSLRHVFGDYALQAPAAMYLQKEAGGATNDLARLAGVRLATCAEAPEGKRGATETIKALGGGEPMVARFHYKEFFEFTPIAKHIWGLNDLPRLRDDDPALWDRVLAVPFSVVIPRDRRLPEDIVHERLAAEAPGVLRWAVDGCLAWQRQGLDPPPQVRVTTESYRAGQNPLADFLVECCKLEAEARVASKAIRDTYLEWARDNRRRPLGGRKFSLRLSALGLGAVKGAGGRREWSGIRLLAEGDRGAPEEVARGGATGGDPDLFLKTRGSRGDPRITPTRATNATCGDPDEELL